MGILGVLPSSIPSRWFCLRLRLRAGDSMRGLHCKVTGLTLRCNLLLKARFYFRGSGLLFKAERIGATFQSRELCFQPNPSAHHFSEALEARRIVFDRLKKLKAVVT